MSKRRSCAEARKGGDFRRPISILNDKSEEGVFCYANEVAFGLFLRMGLVARGTNLLIRRLELSVPPCTQGRGERLGQGGVP